VTPPGQRPQSNRARLRRRLAATLGAAAGALVTVAGPAPATAAVSPAFIVCPDPGSGCSVSNHNQVLL
jgi:hypothetical protein